MSLSSIASVSKVLVGASAVLGAVHLARRSVPLQKRSIERALRYQADAARSTPAMTFRRASEVRSVREVLSAPPVGPLVLFGAEGAGTSSVCTDALRESETNRLLRVDLRERAVAGGQSRTLLAHVVRASGFYFKSRDLADIGFLQSKKDEIDGVEIEKCLSVMSQVLEDAKKEREDAESERRWWMHHTPDLVNQSLKLGLDRSQLPPPLPVLVLDELHEQQMPLSAGGGGGTDADGLRALMRWAIFITGAQLAHVVFITRPDVASKLDDAEPSFRAVRRHLSIGFLAEEKVRDFLTSKEGGNLETNEAAELASTIGGQLKDLRAITHAIVSSSERAGEEGNEDLPWHSSWRTLHRQLLADSRSRTVEIWTRLCDAGNSAKGGEEKIIRLKRAQRFWDACAVLAEENRVPRTELLRRVWSAADGVSASDELGDFFSSGIFSWHVEDGEVFVAAGSPRLRAAFAWMTKDEECWLYGGGVREELRKAELKKRMEELAQRRVEQTADLRARRTGGGGGGVEGAVEGAMNASLLEGGLEEVLELEREATVRGLIEVREEYDRIKWRSKQ